jgi:hypothetical protein
MSDEERLDHGGECYGWEGEPDLTSISEEELKARLTELDEEERALSYRRRVLQGRIDLIRAELVRRGVVALSPADLARVLMGGKDNRSGRADLEGGGF